MRRRTLRVVVGMSATSLLAGLLTAVTIQSSYAVQYYSRPSNGVFNVEGHGWGHGRGMSQWGAYGAAVHGTVVISGRTYTATANNITAFYYPGTASTSIGNPTMRVHLLAGYPTELRVLGVSGLAARDVTTNKTISVPAGYHFYRLFATSTGLRFDGNNGTWVPLPITNNGKFTDPIEFYSPHTYLRMYFPDGSSRDYRGTLRAIRLSSSTLASVDALPMDYYLFGVVPREMPASWGSACSNCHAALESQAIAARSYSEYDREHASGQWDICDTTACQVFGGANYYAPGSNTATPLEDSRTNTAVQNTSGFVRTYGGKAIFAEFSSSNGGWSVASGFPYLTAHPDPYDGVVPNDVHYWKAQLPASVLESHFPAVGHLTQIKVWCRDGNGDWGGRVLDTDCPGTNHLSVELDGVSSNGSATQVFVTGSDVYNAYSWPSNFNGLKSRWWNIYATPPSAPQSPSVSAGSETATLHWSPPSSDGGSPITAYVITASPGGATLKVSAGSTTATMWGLTNGTSYTFTVAAQNAYGTGPSASAGGATPHWYNGDFHSLNPKRLLDTRTMGRGLGPNKSRSVVVAGQAGVPSTGVSAVILDVTVQSQYAGNLAVWPATAPVPITSTVNFTAGATVANTVTTRLGGPSVGFMNHSPGTVQVIVDVVGYYSVTQPGDRLQAAVPARIAATQTGTGVPKAPLNSGQVLTVPVAGHGGVPPTGADAVVLNVTGVGATGATYLTVWPHGTPRPATSNLNLSRGETRAVQVTTALGGGAVDIYNANGSVNVIVDVQGWFSPTATGTAGANSPALPRRIIDSRSSGGPLGQGASRTVKITGQFDIPTSARAVLLNVTAVSPTSAGYLVVYPTGGSSFGTSSLNLSAGQDRANAVLVAPGPDGTVTIYNAAGNTNFIIDLLGWYPAS